MNFFNVFLPFRQYIFEPLECQARGFLAIPGLDDYCRLAAFESRPKIGTNPEDQIDLLSLQPNCAADRIEPPDLELDWYSADEPRIGWLRKVKGHKLAVPR